MASPTPNELTDYFTPGEPYTVSELTDQFDSSTQTIRNRLDSLVEDGVVVKKKHSARTTTYRIPKE